jgi:hypothetical protein
MKKILLSVITILTLISCCKKNSLKKSKYGHYGNVTKIIEYTSLKNTELTKSLKTDTTQIKTSIFKNGLKLKTTGFHTFNQDSLITENFYNDYNQIIKEIVYLADGSNFVVSYKYKDTLINTAEVDYSAEDLSFKTLTNYSYTNKGIVEKDITKQIVTDTNSKDTIQGYIETTIYDSKGNSEKYEIEYLDTINSISKRIIKRDCNGLLKSFKSYENDVFISKTIYEYKFDSIGNWIESREFEKDTLRRVIEKKIIYD